MLFSGIFHPVPRAHTIAAAENTVGGRRLNTAQKVEQLLKEPVGALGFELCDVEFAKEYGDWVLTLYIDKPGGVTIDDCEQVSRAVDPLLDEADPIDRLICSPFVSRAGPPAEKGRGLSKKPRKRIEIKLFAPKDGKKEFVGELIAFDETSLTVRLDKGELTLSARPSRSRGRNWCFNARTFFRIIIG